MSASQHGRLEFQEQAVDPLLESLLFICKLYDVEAGLDMLTASVPLVDGRLTNDSVQAAVANIGLVSRKVLKPLDKISELLLPCILALEDNDYCVLLETNSADGQLKVMRPPAGSDDLNEQGEPEVVWLACEILEKHYTGSSIFFTKQLAPASFTDDTLQITHKHWFWGTLYESIHIYRDVLIASVLINVFALVGSIFTMNVYDKVIPNMAFESLWVLAISAWILFVFDFVIRSLRSYFIDIAGKKSDILLSSKIYAKVMGMRLESRPASVGAFTKHLQEFDSIRDFFTSVSISALIDLPFTLIFLTVIWWFTGWMVLIPAVVILLLILYSLLIQKPLKASIEAGFQLAAQKNAGLVESLVGLETVKLFGAEGHFQHSWEEAVNHISDWGMQTRKLTNSVSIFASFLQQSSTVGIVVLGVYQIAAGSLSMGGLIAALMLSGRAIGPMVQLSTLTTRYNQAMQAMKVLKAIISLPSEYEEGKRYQSLSDFTGHFEFSDVSFTYPNEKYPALMDINLVISPGEKIGIIGRIGSGKTTLERLLSGVFLPTEGQILIDAVDVNQLNPRELRSHFGVVSQDDSLFYGSIRDNITLGNPFVSDEDILTAARRAGVLEFTNRDPQGLEKPVGEGGLRLSGGQRQSVAIARAWLNKPKVLILDEPSSSMDNRTELAFKKQLNLLAEEESLILVTHKTSMLDVVDRLIVMDAGKIVIDGEKTTVLKQLKAGKVRANHAAGKGEFS